MSLIKLQLSLKSRIRIAICAAFVGISITIIYFLLLNCMVLRKDLEASLQTESRQTAFWDWMNGNSKIYELKETAEKDPTKIELKTSRLWQDVVPIYQYQYYNDDNFLLSLLINNKERAEIFVTSYNERTISMFNEYSKNAMIIPAHSPKK